MRILPGLTLVLCLGMAVGARADDTTTPGATGDGATTGAPTKTAHQADLDRLKLEKELDEARKARVDAEKNLEDSERARRNANYPIATVSGIKTGEVNGYEKTAFFADWALSASAQKIADQVQLKGKCEAAEPTLIVEDETFPSKLLGAKFIEKSLFGLLFQANNWIAKAATIKPAPPKAGAGAAKGAKLSAEAGYVQGATQVAQSLITNYLDTLKYFKTDIEFKDAPVDLPLYALRSAVAESCAGAQLPELTSRRTLELIDTAAELSLAVAHVSARLAKDTSLPADFAADGQAIVDTYNAIKTSLQAAAGQPNPLIEAQRALWSRDAKRILVMQVMDQGGSVYKRSNLFFLTARIDYVAAISVQYRLVSLESGTVLAHGVAQARTQLEQRYSRWKVDPSHKASGERYVAD